MRTRILMAAICLAVGGPAVAAEVPRPPAKPHAAASTQSAPTPAGEVPRPLPRPKRLQLGHVDPNIADTAAPPPPPPVFSPSTLPSGLPERPANGAEEQSCDRALRYFARAAPLPEIDDGGGCFIEAPYDVIGAGRNPTVSLVPSATLQCETIRALANWLDGPVQRTARDLYGRSVAGIWVAASYVCRPRNGDEGARLSEHAEGNAIDISGFVFDDGSVIGVEHGWSGDAISAAFLERVHARACGIFTTVIGPDGDADHKTHIHLDLARRGRGGTSTFCQ